MIATIAPYISGRLASACATHLPKIELAIVEDVTENLVRANDDGEIDVAIISTCKPTANMLVQECAREPLLLALPAKHPLARSRQVHARQLKNETILMLEESHCLSHQIRRWCLARKLRPKDATTALQLSTLLSLVAAGQGVCFVPQMAVGNELAKGCAFVTVTGNAPQREINFLRNNSRYQTRAVAAFCGLANEIICAAT
jgi:LysR family hydrogen peroxide-inducible transcriptional activator